MEHLNKHQLILLALLVSFITSMATGIVTVALMDQAPPSVTQTINRVVERTIEKAVVPTITPTNTTTIKETVVVSEDDQVVNTIEKNVGSMVRIYRTNTDITAGTDAMTFVGLGIVVSDDKMIVTDGSLVSEGGKYFTSLSDGKLRDLNILRDITSEQIALLRIVDDEKNPVKISKSNISKNDVRLGQSVVYIGGQTKNSVATGIVSSFGYKDVKIDSASSTSATKEVVYSIDTTIPSSGLISGGSLLNLTGELVGIKGTFLDSARSDLFIPVSAIQNTISAYQESQKKSQ